MFVVRASTNFVTVNANESALFYLLAILVPYEITFSPVLGHFLPEIPFRCQVIGRVTGLEPQFRIDRISPLKRDTDFIQHSIIKLKLTMCTCNINDR